MAPGVPNIGLMFQCSRLNLMHALQTLTVDCVANFWNVNQVFNVLLHSLLFNGTLNKTIGLVVM